MDIEREDLLRLLEGRPAPVLIDVRAPEDYDDGHLPQARNAPADGPDLEQQVDALLAGDRRVVVVVMGGDAEDPAGDLAALRLAEAGHDVRLYRGGVEDWRGAGLPVANTVIGG